MKKGFSLFLLVLALIPHIAAAQTMPCVEVVEGSINEVELKAPDGQANCFVLKNAQNLRQLNFLSKSVGLFGHQIKVVNVDDYGRSTDIATWASNAAGVTSGELPVANRKIGFGILPTTNTSTNKHLSVGYYRHNDVGVIIADIVDLPVPAATPTPPPAGPTDPCKKSPNGGCIYTVRPFSSLTSGSNQCSAASNVPAGKHPAFDIDANLASIEAMKTAIDNYPDNGVREAVRASAMTQLFAPGRPYDLKADGHKYKSSQEFGNYFYGMAAAKMGYTEAQALKAGAVVQQYQNYSNTGHPDANNVAVLARNLAFAAISGLGDNPDDPPVISAGHRAAVTCQTKPPATPPKSSNGGGGEGPLTGLGRGWGSGGGTLVAPGCYGSCGGGGSVNVGPVIKIK